MPLPSLGGNLAALIKHVREAQGGSRSLSEHGVPPPIFGWRSCFGLWQTRQSIGNTLAMKLVNTWMGKLCSGEGSGVTLVEPVDHARAGQLWWRA
jgi:hypothetical protein